MAEWAHACRVCGDGEPSIVYVSAATVAEMPGSTRIVQVRLDERWCCALLQRDNRVSIDRMLLHDAVAASADDCPDCARLLEEARQAQAAAGPRDEGDGGSAGNVQAAAIQLGGHRFVVVLVPLELTGNPGEADMAIERLEQSFGGAPVLLMGQRDDGSPRYYGEPELCELVRELPLERMPWKVYPLR